MEICVIGGGIIGSWTAFHLAEAGVDTTLMEQFPLPHGRGSSHGQSRAFRFLGDDELDRLEYSLERWQGLERAVGETVFVRTGLLNFGPEGDPYLEHHMAVVRDGGRPCDWLGHEEIARRFPMLRYPEAWGAAWDPHGGILVAHRCLCAVQRRFRELGGRIRTARATSLAPASGGGVGVGIRTPASVATERTRFDAVVVCAGPWTGELLPRLRSLLRTVSTPVTYWRDPEGTYAAARDVPILFNARLTDVYALPSYEYPGLVKVLFHGGPESGPEAIDPGAFRPYIRTVADYVEEHLPFLDHRTPGVVETCFYTMTPDGHPVLDTLEPGVVVGAGFSGSGFKHSPATGRMLAALAMDDEIPAGFAPDRYVLDRFDGTGTP